MTVHDVHPAPQHMRALAEANTTKARRRELRRQVAAGTTTVAAALADPACATARVADILAWQHRWGRDRSEAFLDGSGVCSVWQLAGRLTDRQRALIARALRHGIHSERTAA